MPLPPGLLLTLLSHLPIILVVGVDLSVGRVIPIDIGFVFAQFHQLKGLEPLLEYYLEINEI